MTDSVASKTVLRVREVTPKYPLPSGGKKLPDGLRKVGAWLWLAPAMSKRRSPRVGVGGVAAQVTDEGRSRSLSTRRA